MLAYDREITRTLIIENEELSEFYNSIEDGSIDEKMYITYLECIVNNEKFKEKYKHPPVEIGPDTIVQCEIRGLINKYGWTPFRNALVNYSEKKASSHRSIGLYESATVWTAIKEKLNQVRKNAQL